MRRGELERGEEKKKAEEIVLSTSHVFSNPNVGRMISEG